jgi:uracil-DNA glycosylase
MTLSLDTRQRAMLAAMGVRVWQPNAAVEPLVQPDTTLRAEPPVVPVVRPVARVAQAEAAPAPAPAAVALKALPEGLAEMDWAALQNAASLCQACGLCETRQRSVFSNASQLKLAPHPDWLIITDPPSEEEERKGDMFVNTEGELFDAMLLALGMARQASPGQLTATVVPVLKCRVPAQRNPHAEELQQCSAYLERQVALLQPQVIVAMGRWAMQSVLTATSADLATQPLGKLRGQVHRFANTPVVVTYHPQSLLRTPLDKAKAWADLCLAHSLTRRP